jgi:excinuclease ABC subunit B
MNDILSSLAEQDYVTVEVEEAEDRLADVHPSEMPKLIEQLTREMFEAARDLEFEKAAQLRDRIRDIEKKHLRYA